MAGRHSKRGARARIYVQHAIADDAVAQHRHSGAYLVLCGARVLAASLTTPERGQCQPCREALS